MPDVEEIVKERISKDGQILSLKAKFIRELGAKKLAECELIKESSEEPIILLDDAFSELDFQNQEYLAKFILEYNQCLITGLDFSVIKKLNIPTHEILMGEKN